MCKRITKAISSYPKMPRLPLNNGRIPKRRQTLPLRRPRRLRRVRAAEFGEGWVVLSLWEVRELRPVLYVRECGEGGLWVAFWSGFFGFFSKI